MLYTNQLQRFVRLHHRLRAKFHGVYPRNRLPQRRRRGGGGDVGLIVNTDTDNLPGQHWIACVLLRNGRGEVFDSFGQVPPPHVQLWMNRHCPRGWISNNTFIQSPLSSLCGGYCLYYLYERLVYDKSLNSIVHKLYYNGDTIIRNFLAMHSLSTTTT